MGKFKPPQNKQTSSADQIYVWIGSGAEARELRSALREVARDQNIQMRELIIAMIKHCLDEMEE